MKKFEYRKLFIPALSDLNELGEYGWELVCVCDNKYFIFKKEIINKMDDTIC